MEQYQYRPAGGLGGKAIMLSMVQATGHCFRDRVFLDIDIGLTGNKNLIAFFCHKKSHLCLKDSGESGAELSH